MVARSWWITDLFLQLYAADLRPGGNNLLGKVIG